MANKNGPVNIKKKSGKTKFYRLNTMLKLKISNLPQVGLCCSEPCDGYTER